MVRPKEPRLSPLENTVMQVVWELGEARADEVRRRLEATQPMKDSTARTILRRLEEKGYVQHTVEGRTYVYSPKVASRRVAAKAVRGIIDRFCSGSAEDLLVGMVDDEIISAETLQELARRIGESQSNPEANPNDKGR